jgi:superfamily II DNA or RNA helicase
MSCKIKVDTIPYEKRQQIHKELQIKLDGGKFATVSSPRYIFPYEIKNDDIYLPFSYAYKILKLKRPKRDTFPNININFEGTLRSEQNTVKKEALKILGKTGSILLSMYCGFGKSITSIKLACDIGFKTLIIVNKIVLMKQWEQSILRFCPTATVQRLTTKSAMKNCDFYIMNAINIPKKGHAFFKDIGTVICDEAHMIMAETLSKSFQHIYPRYLIGLTATPYRPDGLDILLEFYFGKNKIIRKLVREHIAYKVETGFAPTIKLATNGRVNWGAILDSQASNEERNQLIIDIVRHFKDRTFLILTKRVAQGEYLVEKFKERGESVTSLIGTQQEFEVSSRILVGTCQKCGTGFDHPNLNTLLLAGDVEEYFIQYLGRVFRTKEVKPIIFDLVDKNGILKKHYNTRRSIYIDHGGTVTIFDNNIVKINENK